MGGKSECLAAEKIISVMEGCTYVCSIGLFINSSRKLQTSPNKKLVVITVIKLKQILKTYFLPTECLHTSVSVRTHVQYAMGRHDISLIVFLYYYSESAQRDIYISLKLMWHHRLCSLVKGQRSKSAHKDGLKSYVNCQK